mmetsp:Transcript_4959/g.16586  ORF Transcript_4959/g.16586 Transcript_4959/m.16586 type:complete len:327 (+) Transcript_4959:545-1525(+)
MPGGPPRELPGERPSHGRRLHAEHAAPGLAHAGHGLPRGRLLEQRLVRAAETRPCGVGALLAGQLGGGCAESPLQSIPGAQGGEEPHGRGPARLVPRVRVPGVLDVVLGLRGARLAHAAPLRVRLCAVLRARALEEHRKHGEGAEVPAGVHGLLEHLGRLGAQVEGAPAPGHPPGELLHRLAGGELVHARVLVEHRARAEGKVDSVEKLRGADGGHGGRVVGHLGVHGLEAQGARLEGLHGPPGVQDEEHLPLERAVPDDAGHQRVVGACQDAVEQDDEGVEGAQDDHHRGDGQGHHAAEGPVAPGPAVRDEVEVQRGPEHLHDQP